MSNRVGTSLNLVSARKQSVVQARLMAAKVQFIFGVLLAVYLGLLVVVVVINGGVQLKHKSVLDGIKNEELKIAQLKTREEMLFLVKQKLGYMAGLVGKEWDGRKLFEYVMVTTPENVTYSGVGIAVEEFDDLSLTAEAFDYQTLQNFYGYIKSLPGNELIDSVTLEGVSRNSNGTYGINWFVTLPK